MTKLGKIGNIDDNLPLPLSPSHPPFVFLCVLSSLACFLIYTFGKTRKLQSDPWPCPISDLGFFICVSSSHLAQVIRILAEHAPPVIVTVTARATPASSSRPRRCQTPVPGPLAAAVHADIVRGVAAQARARRADERGPGSPATDATAGAHDAESPRVGAYWGRHGRHARRLLLLLLLAQGGRVRPVLVDGIPG